MKIRFKFTRSGPMRFIGHLDMMRYFQKAVMKSGIKAAYSEGYHPHQIMSFAYPLGVGMETDGDYMDLEMTEDCDPESLMDALNSVMHEGTYIKEVSVLSDTALNAMASVEAADYLLYIDGDPEKIKTAVSMMLDMKEIAAEKSGKNIREGIYEASVSDDGNAVFLKLSSGSKLNVRPADVFATIRKCDETLSFRMIKRLEIYGSEDGKLTPLIKCGVAK